MSIRHLLLALTCTAVALVSCKMEIDLSQTTVLEVSLDSGTKTHMGASAEGERPVYWSEGDQLCLNGVVSSALSGVGEAVSSAQFTFPGVINPPFSLLYPASFYKDADTVTFPDSQTWVSGSFATNTMPMCGYSASPGSGVSLQHLGAVVHLKVRKDSGVDASRLSSVTFSGRAGEQVSGDFTINYETASLTGAAASEEGRTVTLTLSESLSESSDLDLFLVVPAGTYDSGFQVVLTDEYNRTMTKFRGTSITLNPGKLVKMPQFNFVPSGIATEFGLPPVIEDQLLDEYNVTGRVVDQAGTGISGVIATDGLQCVRTDADGYFYMMSDVASTKFVYISTPSGYMPQVENGVPKFYKLLSGITPSEGIYDMGDYTVSAVANPDRYTLLVTADPQPRQYSKWNNDRIAYKSLDVCEDLYQELRDVAGSISGRQVYGICLGDIVHEDMSLFDNYSSALATLGYPTYNIIGNHDNDTEAADDAAGAVPYENHYGPRNYSFNIGGIHFVMLDNLIMKINPDNGNKLTGFDQGLSDDIWTWLQADLAYVPTSSKLMVCAHSPMFRLISGNERTNTAAHGGNDGYGGLLNKYAEVHAWAGHTHVGFNYNYPSSHRHKRVQVHTLARSTGELWTNEYLAAGTPRGFTVVEVDNGNITWKFHPVTRQTAAFVGVTSGICSAGAPAYNWRDWNYNSSGAAVMKKGGALTEDYQMHVYPRGAYGDEYVYVNVFLWDDKWSLPVWTPTGGAPVEMTLLHDSNGAYISDTENIYDLANTEMKTHYKSNVGFFRNDDGYPASEVGEITTMFRAPASATPAGGTVTVTDRFGNVYSQSVSW